MVRRRSPAALRSPLGSHRRSPVQPSAGDSGSGGSRSLRVSTTGKAARCLRRSRSALAKGGPLPEETLGRLEKATKDIAAIKEQVGVSAADAAERRSRPTGAPTTLPNIKSSCRAEECQVVLNFDSATSSIARPCRGPPRRHRNRPCSRQTNGYPPAALHSSSARWCTRSRPSDTADDAHDYPWH